MASFVEQAELILKDSSSKNINKINKSLNELFKTASKFKSLKIDLKVSNSDIKKATASVKDLGKATDKAKSGKINITARAEGLRAVAGELNRLRSQASKPITQRVTANYSSIGAGISGAIGDRFRETLKYAIHTAIREALHNIGHETVQGTKQVDIGEASQKLRGLTDTQIAENKTIVDQVVDQQKSDLGGGVFFNRAELAKLQSDLYSITAGAKPSEIAQLMREGIITAIQGFDLGQDMETAKRGMFDYIKTAEQIRALFKPGTTEFDPEMAEKYFEARRRDRAITSGQSTGQSTRAVVQNTGTAKFGMSNEMVSVLSLLDQEMGQKAGTAISTAMKNFTGNVLVKWKKSNLRELGLLVPTEITDAASGKRAGFVDEEAKDETKLRDNMLRWVIDDVVPKMRERGFDPDNPSQVAQFAQSIASGTGATGLATLITQIRTLTRDLDLEQGKIEGKPPIPGKISEVAPVLQESSRVNVQAVQSEFESTLGELGQKFAVAAIPLMQSASTHMADIAKTINENKTLSDPVALLKDSIVGATGIAALAVTSGLKSMASEDPGVRALGGAATTLTLAGVSLNAAGLLMDATLSPLGAVIAGLGAAYYGITHPTDPKALATFGNAEADEQRRAEKLVWTREALKSTTSILEQLKAPLPGSPPTAVQAYLAQKDALAGSSSSCRTR